MLKFLIQITDLETFKGRDHLLELHVGKGGILQRALH